MSAFCSPAGYPIGDGVSHLRSYPGTSANPWAATLYTAWGQGLCHLRIVPARCRPLAQSFELPSALLQDPSVGRGSRHRHAVGIQPCDACSMRLHGEAGVDVRVWHVSLIGTGTKGRIFKGMPAGVQAHTLAAVCCFTHPKVGSAHRVLAAVCCFSHPEVGPAVKPDLSAALAAAACRVSRGNSGWGTACLCPQPYHSCPCLSLQVSDVHCPHLQHVMVEAVADPGEYGYAKLYALLLGKCQKQLAAALRVFTHPDNFPLLVNCVQGKDRTGLIAMLVLMLCGVPHVVRLQSRLLHGLHTAEHGSCPAEQCGAPHGEGVASAAGMAGIKLSTRKAGFASEGER